MSTGRFWGTALACTAAVLAVVAAFTVTFGPERLPFGLTEASHPPPSAPLGESFSVADGDPLTTTGVHPADILIAGPTIAIPCYNLGLWCTDPGAGARDDLIGLAYDYDSLSIDLPPVEFSVAPGSVGAPGSEVSVEAACSPSEPQADVFETVLDGLNRQDVDGDGVACSTNAGLGFGLSETPAADNVDALERDPYQFVDLDGDSVPEGLVFLTLAPGSPSLAAYGATPRDILMTSNAADAVVWASGADLGLQVGDVIDAICVDYDGDGVYTGAAIDRVLFSLGAGSPSLASISASAADVLRPGPVRAYAASRLGVGSP